MSISSGKSFGLSTVYPTKWRQARRNREIQANQRQAMAVTLISVVPNTDVAAGGVAVTLNGKGFLQGALILATIGGVSITPVVVSDKVITGTTGAHAAGVVDVVVQTSNGTATLTGAFTYT